LVPNNKINEYLLYQSQVNGILEKIWIQQEANNRDYIMSFSLYKLIPIEGSNIEYGDIEKCNIDTKITSKIWRLVTSKKTRR